MFTVTLGVRMDDSKLKQFSTRLRPTDPENRVSKRDPMRYFRLVGPVNVVKKLINTIICRPASKKYLVVEKRY